MREALARLRSFKALITLAFLALFNDSVIFSFVVTRNFYLEYIDIMVEKFAEKEQDDDNQD